MTIPSNIPNLPVEEGARRLALTHLGDAAIARERLTHTTDPEALHDYRVALRRLRACLRAYRPSLRSTVTRKSERRLRRLARATNRARDLEVHLVWLAEERERLAVTEKRGIQWVIERLTAEQESERESLLDLDERAFPPLQSMLSRQLSRFRMTIDLGSGTRRRSTAAATARRVRAYARQLKDRLRQIRGYADVEAIHRARIAAKHLRYLLEPFAKGLPDGPAVIERLKALQDGLGDIHDAHVFTDELARAKADAKATVARGVELTRGIVGLLAVLETRGRQMFQQVARQWMGEAGDPFFARVTEVAEAVGDLAYRDQEVERKFLLTGLPPLTGGAPPVEIEQGYLPGERLVERVRRIESENGVELARTVKEGSGLTRLEVEEPVTNEVFDSLWPLTEGRRLRKRRYRVAEGELTWEIDEFLDRELVLAEIELPPGHPTDVEVPEWLRPHVKREVTGDDAFSNFKLASQG